MSTITIRILKKLSGWKDICKSSFEK